MQKPTIHYCFFEIEKEVGSQSVYQERVKLKHKTLVCHTGRDNTGKLLEGLHNDFELIHKEIGESSQGSYSADVVIAKMKEMI